MVVLALILGMTVLDQVTKLLVMRYFELGQSVPIVPGLFSLTYVRNTGAAWGMFGGFNGALIVVSIVVLVLLALFHRRLMGNTPVRELSLALLASGIIGNLLDRLRFNFVVDFLDFYWTHHHFPTFNIADSAICAGVALYAISVIMFQKHVSTQSAAPDTPPEGTGSLESRKSPADC